ncbi:MAG: PIN domain-containing protein [Ginsengibacter sp.]
MNGANFANVVFDTNAFIYFIGGDERLLQYSSSTVYISEFTEIELKGRFGITNKELQILNEILEDFIILPFNNDIKERAISIRHKNKLKLPDALIVSTAMWIDLPFVTADKDFKNIPLLNLILL